MRIMIVSGMFPPVQSGSSHYADRVARGLSARGHNILVASSRTGHNRVNEPFGHFAFPSMLMPATPISHGYRLPYSFFPISIPLMHQIMKRFEPDIVHANGHFMDVSLAAAICANRLRIPLAMTVHTRLVHTCSTINSLMCYANRSMLRRIWRNAQAVVALDRQMFQYIIQTLGIDSHRVHTIPLAIDIDRLLSYPLRSPNWPVFSGGKRVILSISHLTGLKSARTVLRAFKVVSAEFPDVDLVFAGTVCSSSSIDMVSKLGLHSRVHFLGEVKHEIIPSLLDRSVAEMHSLDSRTGFDNASIEAMTMGVPVISCVREDNFGRPWLQDGENVLLVSPGDVDGTAKAMKLILHNKDVYTRLSKNAKTQAGKFFSIKRLLYDLEEMYESILQP